MVDDVTLRQAVDNAWSVYLATHRTVEDTDSRRCVLERHLSMNWETRESDSDELTCVGLAYLERLPEDETN